MALWVDVDGQRLPAVEIAVERAIGRPVRWRCRVQVQPDVDATADLRQLAGALGRPTARLAAFHDASPLVEGVRPVKAQWAVASRGLLDIEAHTTAAAGDKDVFKPRRRVHRVRTWCALVDALKDVAEASTGVRNHLDRFPFPSASHTSIVQDGESDWELLATVVAQFARFERDPALARLAVVGGNSTGSGTARRWVLNWASGAGYRKYHDVAGRRARGPEADAHTALIFGSVRHAGAYSQPFPTAAAPSVDEQWRDRRFDPGAWRDWLDRDAPFFVGDAEAFAWKAVDVLSEAGQQDVVSWTTELATVPDDLCLESGLPFAEPRPWFGFGVVTQSPDRDQWMEVVLDGFESGEDRLEARVATAYSGTDNTKGLHFVPESGTPVAVAWSGRLMDPPVVLANVRDQPAAFPSPAMWLESTLTSRYAAIDCKSIGAVTIGSDLGVAVDGATEVKSDSTMNLTADGCDVELRGGVFYTGSGM